MSKTEVVVFKMEKVKCFWEGENVECSRNINRLQNINKD